MRETLRPPGVGSPSPTPIPERRRTNDLDAWILGSGIPSLTTAVHLIQEAHVPPERVHIIETVGVVGEGTIIVETPDGGYDLRAGAMPLFNDVCIERLLSLVPSPTDPLRTVLDTIHDFNEAKPLPKRTNTRLLTRQSSGIARVDPRRVGLGLRDRVDLFVLASKTEKNLGRSRIHDYFHGSFFHSNYWLTLATTFGFEPWHSATEFRRCLRRFMPDVHELNDRQPLDHLPYNRHHAVIEPIGQFLKSRGVDFRFGTIINDIIFDPPHINNSRVAAIRATKHGGPETTIEIGSNDIVIVTVGSTLSGRATGANDSAPSLDRVEMEKVLNENWLLWLELSTKNPIFGNAYNFCTRTEESRQGSFTITLRGPGRDFITRFVELTGDQPGMGPLVTLRDSNWLLSINVPHQPVIPNQPDDVAILWGYALHPEEQGNAVKKPMLDCTGREVMTEILHQLEFPLEEILENSVTTPCVVPRMVAPLLARGIEDRPFIIPEGVTNMALIGQFVEIPNEAVVGMDYTVRGAQMAVHHLMGIDGNMRRSKHTSAINMLGLL